MFGQNAWFGDIVDLPKKRGGLTVDPQLTEPGKGGAIGDTRKLGHARPYRLRPSSPLIDKGLDLRKTLGIDMGQRDYFGNTIPAGAGYDIEAHELK